MFYVYRGAVHTGEGMTLIGKFKTRRETLRSRYMYFNRKSLSPTDRKFSTFVYDVNSNFVASP